MKRVILGILKWAGIGLAALVGLALAAVAIVVSTGFGGRMALRVLPRLPVDVSVAGFDGRLIRGFTLTGIEYHSEQIDVAVDTVIVEWRPTELMRKRLQLDRVLVAGVDAVVYEPAPKAEPETTPEDTATAPVALPIDVELGDMRARRVRASLPDGVEVSDVALVAAGRPDDYRVDLKAAVGGGQVPPTKVEIEAEGSMTEARLQRLHARLLDGSVTVSGRATWLPEIDWDVSVAVDSIAPAPLMGDTTRFEGSVTLRAATRGKLTDEGPEAFVHVDTLLGTLNGEVVSGHGELDAFRTNAAIHEFEFRWGGMSLQVEGAARWDPDMEWNLALRADSLAPSVFMPDPETLPGYVTAHISTSGTKTDVIKASLEIDSLFGVLRGLDVSGRGSFNVNGTRVRADSLVLLWGNNEIRLAGVYDSSVDARARIVVPDVAKLLPDAGGSVYFEGSFRGSPEAPDIQANARVDSFHFAGHRARRVRADVDLDLSAGRTVDMNVEALGIETAGQSIDSIGVDATGTTAAHEVDLGVIAQEKSLRVRLSGAWADGTWSGTLARLEAGAGPFGDWALAVPAAIEASKASARADSLLLVSGETRVALSGYWSARDSMGVSLEVDSLAWARASDMYPENVSVTGWLRVALHALVDHSGEVAADLTIESTPGQVSWSDGRTTRAIGFDSTFVSGTVGPEGLSSALSLRLHRGSDVITTVRGTFAMPAVHNVREIPENPEFKSRLQALFTDLAFIGPLSRDIHRTGGRLEADAGLEGTFDDPHFAGTVRLENGRIGFVPLGIDVHDIQIAAEGRRNGLLVTGSMRSGGGVLELNTELQREESHVHVRGENFAVSNTTEAHIRISPDIELKLAQRRLDLEGQVQVPYAKIEVYEVPEAAVGTSPDVVYITADTTQARQPIDIYADLRVTLAQDSVTFRGFGLYGEIQGSMSVRERPRRPTTASGELKIVNGTYDAYGQQLKIDPGRIRYAGGPVDNPGFDIRAFREITQHSVIAGLLIRGTARRPQVTVFSDPSMSQTEALSYLLTGQPLESGSQRDMAAAAALSMGMAQGNAALQGTAREVGLDEARFETGGTMQEASFVAGKYLSPQLYISNTMGLFDRVSTWRVRYFMSRHWTLQAESGKATGSDLFYRFERGK